MNTTKNSSASQPVVLVHGAWHGGWCWKSVQAQLDSAGYQTFTPTMAGLAERAGEMSEKIGLETHIGDIISVFETHQLNDVILMGHSYGGMVITAVADRMRDRLKHIIYLDAALPQNGESMISYNAPSEGAAQAEAQFRNLFAQGIVIPPFPPEALGIATDHPRYNWVKQNLTAHPLKTWLDPVKLSETGQIKVPRTYVHCVSPMLEGTGFPRLAAMARADSAWRYVELQTGHDAMVTEPEQVANLVIANAA